MATAAFRKPPMAIAAFRKPEMANGFFAKAAEKMCSCLLGCARVCFLCFHIFHACMHACMYVCMYLFGCLQALGALI